MYAQTKCRGGYEIYSVTMREKRVQNQHGHGSGTLFPHALPFRNIYTLSSIVQYIAMFRVQPGIQGYICIRGEKSDARSRQEKVKYGHKKGSPPTLTRINRKLVPERNLSKSQVSINFLKFETKNMQIDIEQWFERNFLS